MMFSFSEAADVDASYFIAVPSVVGIALGTSMLLVWLTIHVLVQRDPSISMTPTTTGGAVAAAALEDPNHPGQYLFSQPHAQGPIVTE